VRAKRSDLKAWGFNLTPAAKRKGGKKPPTLPQGGALNQVLFTRLCKAHGLPVPDYEYPFAHPQRKWRADAAFSELDTLVEIEGGAFVQGRHVRGAGFEEDILKYAEAVCRGWFVLRVLPEHVESGKVFEWLKRIQAGE
jgi:hypothetical protein